MAALFRYSSLLTNKHDVQIVVDLVAAAGLDWGSNLADLFYGSWSFDFFPPPNGKGFDILYKVLSNTIAR